MGGRPSGVFRCGAYFLYRCVLNAGGCEDVCVGQFERDASPRRLPQCSKREAVRSLSHNVLRLAAARPRHGVLAYERGDGGSLRDKRLSGGDIEVVCGREHLDGFARFAEFADAIARWLEETGWCMRRLRRTSEECGISSTVDNASIQKSAVPASAIDRHKRLVITFTYFEVYINTLLYATVSVWWWRTGKFMFSAAYLTTGNALNRREGKRVKFRTPLSGEYKVSQI